VLKRPGVEEFIEKMCGIYEVVIFTASLGVYGKLVLDKIDMKGLIPHKLYRDCCTVVKGGVVKNLANLGRNLKDIIIVDNSPSSYALQPCNGIPIKSWTNDKSDRELEELTSVLELLAKVNDVRDYLRELVIVDKIDYKNLVKLLKYGSPRSGLHENILANSKGILQLENIKLEYINQRDRVLRHSNTSLIKEVYDKAENSCIILIDDNKGNDERIVLVQRDMNRLKSSDYNKV
jgi:Dullard-like phosphatase family protein